MEQTVETVSDQAAAAVVAELCGNCDGWNVVVGFVVVFVVVVEVVVVFRVVLLLIFFTQSSLLISFVSSVVSPSMSLLESDSTLYPSLPATHLTSTVEPVNYDLLEMYY